MQAKFDIPCLTRGAVAAACALALATGAAQAGIVTASFNGSVTGVVFDGRALADYPIGTAVNWQFTFDDAFLALNANDNVFAVGSQLVTGSARVGADTYALNFARLYSYRSDSVSSDILEYTFQVEGSGPQSVSGGDFFGAWLTFDPSLRVTQGQIGYGFTTVTPDITITNYGYLQLAGDYRLTHNAVPAPATAWLVLPALALLAGRRRAVRS
jgi:hypothetical protein